MMSASAFVIMACVSLFNYPAKQKSCEEIFKKHCKAGSIAAECSGKAAREFKKSLEKK